MNVFVWNLLYYSLCNIFI